MRTLRFLLLAILFAVAPGTGLALAEPRDHDRARQAVIRGEIKPLADILNGVRGKLPGEVTGVEIEREGGRWVYEFKVINDKGRLFDVYVDAASGEIQRVKEK